MTNSVENFERINIVSLYHYEVPVKAKEVIEFAKNLRGDKNDLKATKKEVELLSMLIYKTIIDKDEEGVNNSIVFLKETKEMKSLNDLGVLNCKFFTDHLDMNNAYKHRVSFTANYFMCDYAEYDPCALGGIRPIVIRKNKPVTKESIKAFLSQFPVVVTKAHLEAFYTILNTNPFGECSIDGRTAKSLKKYEYFGILSSVIDWRGLVTFEEWYLMRGEEEGVDLFESHHKQPVELANICDSWAERIEDGLSYEDCNSFLEEIEAIGFTCKYDLSGELFDLEIMDSVDQMLVDKKEADSNRFKIKLNNGATEDNIRFALELEEELEKLNVTEKLKEALENPPKMEKWGVWLPVRLNLKKSKDFSFVFSDNMSSFLDNDNYSSNNFNYPVYKDVFANISLGYDYVQFNFYLLSESRLKKKYAEIEKEENFIQADLERCEAEITTQNPFGMGDSKKIERCSNKPTTVLTEKEKGEDGLKGSMSLCDSCLEVAKKELDMDMFTIEKINQTEITNDLINFACSIIHKHAMLTSYNGNLYQFLLQNMKNIEGYLLELCKNKKDIDKDLFVSKLKDVIEYKYVYTECHLKSKVFTALMSNVDISEGDNEVALLIKPKGELTTFIKPVGDHIKYDGILLKSWSEREEMIDSGFDAVFQHSEEILPKTYNSILDILGSGNIANDLKGFSVNVY